MLLTLLLLTSVSTALMSSPALAWPTFAWSPVAWSTFASELSLLTSRFWMPPNASLHGIAVDRLMRWNLIALGLCFLIAHLLLLIAILRRPRPAASQAAHASQIPPPTMWAMEVLPLSLLCVMYLWMAVTAQRLWAANRFEGPSPAALQVEVVGVQFQWYFRYPGRDAAFGVTRPELVHAAAGNPLGLDANDPHSADDIVASEMVLPAGREVDITLRAHDVIHGFFVPAMRLKQNAVPAMVLHVHFTPALPGDYPILCSQVCGLGHARMQATMRVLSPMDYEHWLSGRESRRRAANAAPGNAAPGQIPMPGKIPIKDASEAKAK